jgi:hypothetical protein
VSFVQFFGLPPSRREPERQPEVVRPDWCGPSEDELGVVVPLGAVVGRSERGAVALSHATAFSNGLRLHVVARGRGLSGGAINRAFHEQHLFAPGEEPAEGFIRFGLELPGGVRVSNLGGRFPPFDEEPDGPVFFENGGGGGSGGHDTVLMQPAYWLWPLPEPGPIRVSCEWPLVGIGLSTVEIDGAALVAAAASVIPLWP